MTDPKKLDGSQVFEKQEQTLNDADDAMLCNDERQFDVDVVALFSLSSNANFSTSPHPTVTSCDLQNMELGDFFRRYR